MWLTRPFLPRVAVEMCPYGINPTSSRQEDKKIRLRITASGGVSIVGGVLTITFHAHTVEFEMPLTRVNSDVCTSIFRRFQNLGDLVTKSDFLQQPVQEPRSH
jgi:hypothetical protein